MTILFLSRLFYPHIGGVEKHVWEIAVRLMNRGHSVTVVSEEEKDTYQSTPRSAREGSIYDFGSTTTQKHRKKSENTRKKSEKGEGQLSVYKISVPKNERLKKWIVWWWLFRHRVLIEAADVIHCHDVFFWYLPFRFIYPKKPTYTTFHGYETVFPPAKSAIIVRRLAELLSIGNICVGGYIEKWYDTKPTYVTYGGATLVKSEKLIIKSYKEKLKILFVGRLEKDTGVPTYLEALKILKGKGFDFELEVCGDGPLRNKSEQSGKVHGFVSDLSPFMAWADFVFASSYLSILEAFAWKKLVFSIYDNSLKRDYLTMAPFSKWLMIEKNPRKLAEKIVFYRNNENEKERMIGMAHEWVKGQTWDKVTDLYLTLWRPT